MPFPRKRMQLLMVLLLGASSYAFYCFGEPEMACLFAIISGMTMLLSAVTILLDFPLPPSLTEFGKSDLWLAQKYGTRDCRQRRTGSGRPIGWD
jgi:hypothetical protein